MQKLRVISELITMELIEPLMPIPYVMKETPKAATILIISKKWAINMIRLEEIGLVVVSPV